MAICLAGQADAFAPTACGTVAVRSHSAALSLRMAEAPEHRADRRSMLLRGAALAVMPLAAAAPASAFELPSFDIPNLKDLAGSSRGEKPSGLGPIDNRFLSSCDSDNCVSTSDDVYSKRFLPPWTFNDEGQKEVDAEDAMEQLVAVVSKYKGAKIIKQTDTYIYAEFERELGFVDDVEFLIKVDPDTRGGLTPFGVGTVEYRSGARKSKKSDHRSRIKALRMELQKKGWKSVGYR